MDEESISIVWSLLYSTTIHKLFMDYWLPLASYSFMVRSTTWRGLGVTSDPPCVHYLQQGPSGCGCLSSYSMLTIIAWSREKYQIAGAEQELLLHRHTIPQSVAPVPPVPTLTELWYHADGIVISLTIDPRCRAFLVPSVDRVFGSQTLPFLTW